jgi:UDP-N-acetylglucosamine:LPS N-acetylglucosamine transferase
MLAMMAAKRNKHGERMTHSEKRILVLYTDSGYGHVATSRALAAYLPSERNWRIETIDVYREILTSLDPFYAFTGKSGPDIYNEYALRRGHTMLLWPLLAASSSIAISLGASRIARKLASFWATREYDMVISVMPLINGAIAQSLRRAGRGTPFVTIVTDFCEPVHAAWIQSPDQYLVAGTEKCLAQARRFGLDEDHVLATKGLMLSPKFHALKAAMDPTRRDAEHRRLGLAPDRLTGLMMFGGQGANRMLAYAAAIESAGLPVQMIYACGSNAKLTEAIRALPGSAPRHVLPFTGEIERIMAASDFFVGKPGPGSISEAMVMGLPMILETGSKLLAQERYNAIWAREIGAAEHFKNAAQLISAIARLLAPPKYQAMRNAIDAVPNSAIFELPGLLDAVFTRHEAAGPAEKRRT